MDDLSERIASLSPEKRAALLDTLRRQLAGQDQDGDRIEPRGEGADRLSLSYPQQQLWFLDQLDPGKPTYNIPVALRLSGELDVDALRGALSGMVRRHEALRTTFASQDGVPYQVVAAPSEVDLPVQDVSGLPAERREEAALEAATEEAKRPFDLERGPLFRARLIRLDRDEHVLTLTLHHSVSDGWSVGLVTSELGELYGALREGRDPAVPDLPVQYADFAIWQRAWLADGRLEEQLGYWRDRLAGLGGLEFPADRSRPPVASYRGAIASRTMPPELLDRLGEVAREHGATLYMTLLAAFDVLVARYTGQDDLVLGSITAGRRRPEVEPLIGFFVNVLVMRMDASGNPAFAELLDRVKDTVAGAHANQDVPFEKLVDDLRPERDPSRNPIFQVSFTMQNASALGADARLPGLRVRLLDVDPGISRFDMSWNAAIRPEGLVVWVDYSTDLFDRARMDRMLGHYQRVLEAVASDPALRVSEVPLLTEEEAALVLRSWNDPPLAFRDLPVHRLIAERAAAAPGSTAIVFQGTRVTYAELDERANRVAHHLLDRGVGRGDVVGVALDRGPDWVVAVLGALKAGAGYLPMDPSHPARRLAFMLEDAGARAVLTSSAHRSAVPGGTWTTLALDAEAAAVAGRPGTDPAVDVQGRDLCYVIYTSGSTGKPKGVMIEHRSLADFVTSTAEMFSLTTEDRVVQFASPTFDVSVFETFATLCNGATLVMAPVETLHSPQELQELLRRNRVTLADLPPAIMPLLDPGRLPDLRVCFVGGEAFSGDLVNRWNTEGRLFVNGYGPTECTVTVIAYACEHRRRTASPPIGRAMANHRAYVLDRFGNPAPIGVSGEIHVAGPGVARGYLGRPELTASRFPPDRFGDEPGARMYATGDLGRWREDGQMEFVGRIDQQVKLRGYRIELEEVEAVLASHPGVRTAAVALREDSPGDRRLVAYVVHGADGTDGADGAGGLPVAGLPGADGHEGPSVSDLRAHLAQELPGYMIPSAFVAMDQLPLSPSGKVDRSALPAPETARPDLEGSYVAPRSQTEELLATDIFASVLGVSEVGVNDTFFDLGGNSLQATQLVSRIRNTFGAQVGLRDFYTAPTVADLARVIEQGREQEDAAASPPAGGPAGSAGEAQARWELLSQVEQLSDEEVARLLADRGVPRIGAEDEGGSGDG